MCACVCVCVCCVGGCCTCAYRRWRSESEWLRRPGCVQPLAVRVPVQRYHLGGRVCVWVSLEKTDERVVYVCACVCVFFLVYVRARVSPGTSRLGT